MAVIPTLPQIRSIERMVEIPFGDWTIRGKLDLLGFADERAIIVDYKTSLSLPRQEDFERRFQGQFYALLAAEGVFEDDDLEHAGERVAPGPIQGAHVTEIYPRYRSDDTGELSSRYAYYDRADLVDFKTAVGTLLERLDHGLKTGEWPATPGNHCARCPAPRECPIPEHHRYIEEITSDAEAEAVAGRWTRLKSETARLHTSLREWAAENGAISLGDEAELTFTLVESEPVKNKEQLKKALAGQGVDPGLHFVKRTSTRFGMKKKERE